MRADPDVTRWLPWLNELTLFSWSRRPLFGFLTSMNSLIDLASMGLIGQKGSYPLFLPSLPLRYL